MADVLTTDRDARQRSDRWRAVDSQLTRLTEAATPQVRRLFRREAAAIDRILAEGGATVLERAIEEGISESEWESLLERLWLANGELYFDQTVAEIQTVTETDRGLVGTVSFFGAAAVLAEVGSHVTNRAQAIVGNTRRRIRGVVERAASRAAENLDALIRTEISVLYTTWEAGRSAAIARHNVMAATALAQHAAAGLSGAVLVKEWVSMADDRVRPAHSAADGQTTEFEGTYLVGGEHLRYPRDPAGSARNTANCRCQSIYRPPTGTV